MSFLPATLGRRSFSELNEREILALAIHMEEDDVQIYRMYAHRLRSAYPDSAKIFEDMASAEDARRRSLIDLYKERFGDEIPLIRREHVSDCYSRRPIWLVEGLGLERTRNEAVTMGREAASFYRTAARRARNPEIRKLLGDLASAEDAQAETAEHITSANLPEESRDKESDAAHRQFVLTWAQPGVAGLMDGSVSTLAPIFATAFATQHTWTTFTVGLAASVGAGISMGFTEAASDDGELSGRGSPTKRGVASGVMTTLGGLGHALPYLLPDFWVATTTAIVIVFIELWAIAWIQNRYMATPILRAIFQVVLGGALVFAAGVLIGSR